VNANEPMGRSLDSVPDALTASAGPPADAEPDVRLHRWLVYFASGSDWSRVGEFVATDATAAVERAKDVFGEASAYRAEHIPWDFGQTRSCPVRL
jgi:hypothetical protein